MNYKKMNYYLEVFKKYAVFEGRARRAEYWYFYLFNLIISIVLVIISLTINDSKNIIGILYGLVLFVPGLAVTVRRLHDVGKSGWMVFISLVPIIGPIWLLILLIRDSNQGDNEYGPNPKVLVSSVSTQ